MHKLPEQLVDEAARVTNMLQDKVVKRILRPRDSELILEFQDGTRFFIDSLHSELELSIT